MPAEITYNEFIMDLLDRRGNREASGPETVWIRELFGQIPVETSQFIPDAETYRGDYFYDAKNNQLLRRTVIVDKYGKTAVWKVAGGY